MTPHREQATAYHALQIWGLQLGGPAAESPAGCSTLLVTAFGASAASPWHPRQRPCLDLTRPSRSPLPTTDRPTVPFLSFPFLSLFKPPNESPFLWALQAPAASPFPPPSPSRCEFHRQSNHRIPRLLRAHPLWPPPSQNTNDPEPRHTPKRGGASLQTPTNGLTRVPRSLASPGSASASTHRASLGLLCELTSLPACLCFLV